MIDKNKDITGRLKLDLLHGFGSLSSKGYRNCISILDQENFRKVVFPLGQYLAVKQIDFQDMNFIKLDEKTESIVSMAICTKKMVAAVCEKQYQQDAFEQQQDQYQYQPKYSSQPRPFLAIYSLSDKKNQMVENRSFIYDKDTQMSSFVALSFSSDGRYLACLTGHPEYKLIFLDLNSNKREIEIASAFLEERLRDVPQKENELKINKISVSPKDSHQVALLGPEIFMIVRIQESSFVPITQEIKRMPKKKDNCIYTDAVWFDNDKIALATSFGEIFIMQDSEVKQHIQKILEDRDERIPIDCITPFSKGLIIGCEAGNFAVWMKAEDPDLPYSGAQGKEKNQIIDQLHYLIEWSDKKASGVSGMDISSNEELLVIAFKNNQVATLDLTKVIQQVPQNIKALKRDHNQRDRRDVQFDYLYKGFHNGPISSIDVCIQRPLLVTCCSQDNSIIIWNYASYKCELARKFPVSLNNDEINRQVLLSVAFHPTGYYLAAGFFDKLRIYHVLNDKLRTYREISVKNCTIIRFSNGGQYIAAGSPISKFNKGANMGGVGTNTNTQFQNSNALQTNKKSVNYVINIYNAYTLENITCLKGHTGAVTDLIWTKGDKKLFSCGEDGQIYVYTTDSWEKKDIKLKTPNVKLQSMLFNEPQGTLMVTGPDDVNKGGYIQTVRFREDRDEQICDTQIIKNYHISSFTFNKCIYNTTGIIAGTSTGQIRVYPSLFAQQPFDSVPTHNGQVSHIIVSKDGRFVFTGGKDGSVFIFKVSELNAEGHSIKADQNDTALDKDLKIAVDEKLADVVLVERQEIDVYLGEQKKLKEEYENLENKMEIQALEEKNKMEREIKEMETKMRSEIKSYEQRYEDLKFQKNRNEKEHGGLLKELEKTHLKAIEELENLYEKKLAFENEKFLQQEQELIEERMKFEKKLKEIERKHDDNINSLKYEFNDNFQKAQKVYDSTKQTADDLRKIYEERLAQQEEEHEQEIRDLNENHKKEITKLVKDLAIAEEKKNKFDEDNKKAKENITRLDKKIEDQDNEIQYQKSRLTDASNQIDALKKDIISLEDLVKKKEKKIHEYKYKINDLQKSKHVLSFRTTEMRKSLEPKEEQIEKQKEQLCKLESEFEGLLKVSEARNDKMKKMQSQIENLNKNLKLQTELTNQKENILNKIIMEIHDSVTYKQDPKELAQEMQKLYQTYVLKTEHKQKQYDNKGVQEMGRQIQHLNKTIQQISESSNKLLDRRYQDIFNKTKENAELIYDLNDMRKQNKEFQSQILNLRMKEDKYIKEIANLKTEIQKLKLGGPGGSSKKNNNMMQLPPAQQMQQQQYDEQRQNVNSVQQTQRNNFFSQSQGQVQSNQRPQSMKIGQKGTICRGKNFDTKTLAIFDKAKMMDMTAEMELNTQKLLQQEVLIKSIRRKIHKHVIDRACNDIAFEEELMALQAQEQGGFIPLQQQDIDNSDDNIYQAEQRQYSRK
ncbi:hypothetical protein ABPG72_012463 [Tetrahymena utriculariae]